ncbi:MAG: CarD family transcriptional regulator [Clostridia bacterium]|nr:CarD family transcriptional regulator [Clostridia bacterium]
MYSIGDKVVYPMYGAGIIEAIEEQEFQGVVSKYYVMKMPMGDMKVMIPTLNAERIGIRDVIDGNEADKVLEEFANASVECDLSWNKRYRENMVKIKGGNIYEVARVVKMLMTRDREKGLSTGEKKMLSSAKQILVSELVLAKNVTQNEIESIFEAVFTAE